MNRTLPLWAIQVVVATVSLSEALLLAYLNYKVGLCLVLQEGRDKGEECWRTRFSREDDGVKKDKEVCEDKKK